MVFGEDLPALYHAFHDRFGDPMKEQKLIKCQICCLDEVPSHSKNSSVCEMCFDDDFWQKMEEVKRDRVDMIWAVKVISDGMASGSYFAKGQYLSAGLYTDPVDSLGQARFFQTKTYAEQLICNIHDTEKLISKRDTTKLQLPVIKILQI